MSAPRPPRAGRIPRPLDVGALDALAVRYVARYATTSAKLLAYLRRKLKERGWDADAPADLPAVVERCVAAGFVDDRAYAESKSEALARRGFGNRRIDQALFGAGIDRAIVAELTLSDDVARDAAQRFARRKRFGCFGPPTDPDGRRRQLAAMLRAGHSFQIARECLAQLTEHDDDPEQFVTFRDDL